MLIRMLDGPVHPIYSQADFFPIRAWWSEYVPVFNAKLSDIFRDPTQRKIAANKKNALWVLCEGSKEVIMH